MKKLLVFQIILCVIFPNLSVSEEFYFCQTQKSHGFEFIGRDRNEIIQDLGLMNFKIKLSRSREDIIKDIIAEKKEKDGYYISKSSHFLEMTIMKNVAYRYSDIMECSWRFDIRYDRKQERSFTCIDTQKKTDVFNLDYGGNFFYSSDFGEIYDGELNKNKFTHRETLHTLSGLCKKIRKKNE